MELTSPSFHHDGPLPARYTCDGEGLSPTLDWRGAPVATKGFALTCVDPDAPSGNFVHWLVHGIAPNVTSIAEGRVPDGADQVENDGGSASWTPACPPNGSHRYVFTLYALDKDHLGHVTKDQFITKAEEHALDKATLIGTYER